MLDNPTPPPPEIESDAGSPTTAMGWSRVKMLSFTCKVCGEVFEKTEHRVHSVIRSGGEVSYCSNDCKYRRDSKLQFTCEWCGTEFKRYPSDIAKAESRGAQIRYCSKQCEFEKKGQTNVTKSCEVCGVEFTIWQSAIKHAAEQGWTKRYCSRECSLKGDYHEQRKKRVVVACLNCGKKRERVRWFLRRGNYCNRDCFFEHRHKKALRKHQKSCFICGELLHIREGEAMASFGSRLTCSKECALERGVLVRLGDAERQTPYPKAWNTQLKNSIRRRDKYACQECGVIESGRKHDVHHIDFDKSNCDDYNLILLCHSCHCRTTNSSTQDYWVERYQDLMQERYQAAA